MAVNAFKSKYTGEQIDNLLDVLSSGKMLAPQAEEGQYYTLEQPYPEASGDWLKIHTYKTKDMTVTLTPIGVYGAYGRGYGAHLCSLFNTNTNHGMHYYGGGATLTFDFNSPINPWRIRYNGNVPMTVQVYDGTVWTTKANNVSTGTHDITSTNISQIKITFTGTETHLYYCILDFLSDNYIHNPTIYNK